MFLVVHERVGNEPSDALVCIEHIVTLTAHEFPDGHMGTKFWMLGGQAIVVSEDANSIICALHTMNQKGIRALVVYPDEASELR